MGRRWARCPHDQVVQPHGGGRQGRDGGADKPANRRIGSNRGACSPLPSARPRVWNAEKLDATSVRGRALPGRPGGAAGERAPCAAGLIGPVSDRRRAPRRAQGQRFWPPNRALGLPCRANTRSSAAANASCSGMKGHSTRGPAPVAPVKPFRKASITRSARSRSGAPSSANAWVQPRRHRPEWSMGGARGESERTPATAVAAGCDHNRAVPGGDFPSKPPSPTCSMIRPLRWPRRRLWGRGFKRSRSGAGDANGRHSTPVRLPRSRRRQALAMMRTSPPRALGIQRPLRPPFSPP